MILSDVIKCGKSNTGYMLIDSRWTDENGYISVVHECDENGEVANWEILDGDIYVVSREMEKGHKNMVEKYSKM